MELITKGTWNSMYYLDQLSDDEIWIHKNRFPSYIKETYNISHIEYYNLITRNDKNYIHVCEAPGCTNPTEFRKLTEGYVKSCSRKCADILTGIGLTLNYETRPDSERISHGKHISEASLKRISLLSEEERYSLIDRITESMKSKSSSELEEIRSKISDSATSYWNKLRTDPELSFKYEKMCSDRSDWMKESYKSPSLSRIKSQARRDQTYLMRTNGRHSKGYFYLVKFNNNLFKFGVTSSLSSRLGFFGGPELLLSFQGRMSKLAKLEYKLKESLRLFGEHFENSRIDEVILLINKYRSKFNFD